MDKQNTIEKNSAELGDIFRIHRQDYCENNTLSPHLYKVINAMCNCRTDVLGGHTEQCDHCELCGTHAKVMDKLLITQQRRY